MAEPLLYSAAGNRFAVLDGFGAFPLSPSALALELCRRFSADGLLIGAPPLAGGDCRMLVYNRDGSRAESSGNGLRCLARWAVEHARAVRDELVIETDAGARRVELVRRAGAIVAGRAELGTPHIVERQAALAVAGGELCATLVELGNPHCVLLVEDIERAPVETLGPLLERHSRFPERANVSFAAVATASSPVRLPPGVGGESEGGSTPFLRVRTWERGVGETASCGTGASASAVTAILLGRARSPVSIETRGGRLEVTWDGQGPLSLAGPVDALEPARRS